MSINKYTVEEIPVGQLAVDRRVQRSTLDTLRVERMIHKYNPDAVGVLHVSRRDTGEIVVLDGQHRREVLLRRFGAEQVATCHVFTGLTLAEEAEIFLDLNTTNKPTIIDKFNVRVTAEGPEAVAINEILKSYGWQVSRNRGNFHCGAVGVYEKMYTLGVKSGHEPNTLQAAVMVVTRAWGGDPYGMQAVIIEGIGRVIHDYNSKVQLDHMVEKLREFRGGPATLHAEASQMATVRRGKVSMAVAELVVETYNRNKKNDSKFLLPRWSKRS